MVLLVCHDKTSLPPQTEGFKRSHLTGAGKQKRLSGPPPKTAALQLSRVSELHTAASQCLRLVFLHVFAIVLRGMMLTTDWIIWSCFWSTHIPQNQLWQDQAGCAQKGASAIVMRHDRSLQVMYCKWRQHQQNLRSSDAR